MFALCLHCFLCQRTLLTHHVTSRCIIAPVLVISLQYCFKNAPAHRLTSEVIRDGRKITLHHFLGSFH